MKTIYRTVALAFAVGLVLAACSTGSGYGKSADAGTKPPPTTTAATETVKTATSPLGTILVNGEGRTLYALTNDANGTSTCEAECAATWPPVVVTGSPKPAAGLDPAAFSTVTRSDGSSQLKAGKWPVYLFSGDSQPGDVNGQGSGGVWFVVAPDGSLIKN
jgi:predicted lipoprotein with Yx(FWY)xxD motif